MASAFDANTNELIEAVAEDLKKIPEISPPAWSSFVKTGRHKERPPARGDWWHVRAAAVLRSVKRLGPVGVSKLRSKYGGKKNRGAAAEHAYKGSGNILRKVLQQLEKAGLVKQSSRGIHKGRVITPKGQSVLDKAAIRIIGKENIKKRTVEKLEPKPKAEKKRPKKAEAQATKEREEVEKLAEELKKKGTLRETKKQKNGRARAVEEKKT